MGLEQTTANNCRCFFCGTRFYPIDNHDLEFMKADLFVNGWVMREDGRTYCVSCARNGNIEKSEAGVRYQQTESGQANTSYRLTEDWAKTLAAFLDDEGPNEDLPE